MSARHVVGIDLGTTHCAVAVAPISEDAPAGGAGVAEILRIPQLVTHSAWEPRSLLPSFLYVAHASEGAFALPWDATRTHVVGEYARSRGLDAPARLVSSAKSWLSHPTLDRRSGILPALGAADVEKISPVEASFRYLEHIAEAYDAAYAAGTPALSLAEQDVILTVPASFDASARELTVEAALAAGLSHLTLLEEPESALYAWIAARPDSWRKHIRVGDVVLVVDVGGGTTDFSVMAAVDAQGTLELVRVAVGDHILLGGDNMDWALAYLLRQKLEGSGQELDRFQVSALAYACREAKERMLSDGALHTLPVTVAGRGSQLFGNTVGTDLTRAELTGSLLEGFFPAVASTAHPQRRARAGLTQVGLPYAADAAITKHLAAFLARQADALQRLRGRALLAEGRSPALLHPTAVLFNGGVMKSAALQDRLMATLEAWITADGGAPPRRLEGGDLDLAVARGAAAFGLAKRGRGLRIRGGTARAYYVGMESPAPAVPGIEPPVTALCVAPFGMEEGQVIELADREVAVVVGERVQFRFFGSTVRRGDGAGAELERWAPGEVEELAPIEVVLPADGRTEGEVVPVRLHASVTEIGTLLLEAVPTTPRRPDERWRIELSVRSSD